MDTNFDKNTELLDDTKERGGFWHGGWGFFIFLIFLVGIMVGISYLVKWLF